MPLSQVEQFQYNDRGQQTLYVSFEGVVTESVYNNATGGSGRLVEKRFFDNLAQYNNGSGTPSEIVRYSLDEFGRTVQVIQDADGNLSTTGDQRVTDKVYDDQGRVVSVASPEGTIHYEYDEVTGKLLRTYTGSEDTTGVPASGDGVAVTDTSYAYDALGRVDTVTVTERFDIPLAVAEQIDYVYGLTGLLEEIHLPGNVITDYQFDDLDRLDLMRTFRDTDSDNTYTAGVDALLAEYDYDVRADGKRTGVTEIDDQGRTTRIDWSYDDVGRLIRESYDSFDDSLDFIADYVFDLTGNRKEKKTDTDPTFTGNPTFDETVSYVFDKNDRLLSETLDAPGTANDRFTIYEYGPNASSGYGGDHTTRTKKTVYQGLDSSGVKLSEDGYTYTRQGRLWIAQRDTNGDGTVDQTLKYEYNDNGVRVSSEVDGTKTLFLVDENNLTGYAQVLEELDAALAVIRSYTIGLDVLSQSSSSLPSTVYSLLYDGHGSVRGLADSSGLIVSGQIYRFDAYGNAIGFDPASALTSLLYSGELYDAQLQLQYLRARWYDLSTGTFNRLDPFFGNLRDPQSLHKYAYVHGDPVQGVDPTGLFFLAELGKAIHKEINELYEITHMANRVTYGQQVPGTLGRILPDIIDFSLGQIGEIKPLSPYGVATGELQVRAAIGISNGLRITYRGNSILVDPVPHSGPQPQWIPLTWQPGIRVLWPQRHGDFRQYVAVTLGTVNGVIYYHRIRLPRSALLGVAASFAIEQYAAQLSRRFSELLLDNARDGLNDAILLLLQYRLEAIAFTAVGLGAAMYGQTLVSAARNYQLSFGVFSSLAFGGI